MNNYVFKNPYVNKNNNDVTVRKTNETSNSTEPYVFKNQYVKLKENEPGIKTISKNKINSSDIKIDYKNSNSTINTKTEIHNAIPIDIYKAIESLELSRIMKEKLIKLICLIMQKCMYKNHDFTSYILLASTYFEKAFGKDYHNDFFKAAKNSGIIECNGVYKRGTKKNPGIPYGYRLNQNMLNCSSVPVFYQDKKSGGSSIESGGCDNLIFINRDMTYQKNDIINDIQDDISKKTVNFSNNISNSLSSSTSSFSSTISLSSNSLSSYHIIPRFFDKAIIFDDLSSLVFNEKRLWEATQEHISLISSRLLVDDKVERNFFKVNNTTLKTYYDISKKSALSWATENNVNLIQDGNHFYFKKIEQYIEDKKQSLVASYNWQMTKLKNEIFYAGRNEVNKRLDHNLTCVGKHLMKVIKEDNDLVEIDIKNSQFAIHAYWMKQEDLCVHADVQKYYVLCVTGTLYEGLAESLNISRSQAKQLMMEIAFSSIGNNTPAKALFKKEFPNVIAHIDGFKRKKNDYKLFSNELQQLEAEMVVDNLYPNIKDLGIFCITKHDSLIIKKADKDIVIKIVQSYFRYIGFECTLSIEDKFTIRCINNRVKSY